MAKMDQTKYIEGKNVLVDMRHPDCEQCYKCRHMTRTEIHKTIKGTFALPVCRLTLFNTPVIGFEDKLCKNFESKE